MEKPNLRQIVVRIILLATAYIITGRLALLLAIPPGFATAIFPPVGVGLASVLLWGDSMLGGVLIGSTLLNMSISLSAGREFSWPGLLIAFGIAVGNSLHNAIAAILIRKFVGFPTSLSDERSVILFLLIGGPFACLVSATFGVTVLYLAGAVNASQYAFSWWTWWIGDGTGVLIATPFMLVFFAKPRDIWSRRRTTVALPLLIGCAVLVATFFRASRIEQEGITARFKERARLMMTLVKSHFESSLDVVVLEERFMTAAPQSGRAEFSTFAGDVRAAHPELQATEWVVRVRKDERAHYEEEMVGLGFAGFSIRERNAQHEIVPAKQRDDYAVVTYVEPYASHARAVGFDMASEATRKTALDWARDHDEPAMSAPIELVQDGSRALLLLQSVYSGAPKNVTERREKLRGFICGIIDPHTLVNVALANYAGADYQFHIRDITIPNSPQVIFSPNRNDDRTSPPPPFLFRDSWQVASRTIEMTVTPTQSFIQTNRSLQAWVVLAGGFGLCGLLGAFLLLVSGRTSHIEKLVEERTLELSAVLDNAAEAIITFNSDGFIERVNPAAVKLFDQSPEKLRSHRITDLLPQIDWQAKQRDSGQLEVRGYRPDETTLSLEMTLSQMEVNGRTLFTAMLHDISARKRAERLKNEFVSTVSHELRTPLTSISGSLGLVAGGVVGEVSDEVRELIEIAKVNAERLTLLVNDILDIEKHVAGKLDVACEVTDLGTIVRQSLVQNRGYADRYGTSVVIDERRFATEPVMTNVDASRILQVMANLLSNAIKFSPNGGKVEVSLVVEHGHAVVAVHDQGPGIPDDFKDRVFEKFAQADGADTRTRGGTGLGLSISKAIIERFGGTIGFDSGPRGGSTFYFKLPLAKPAA